MGRNDNKRHNNIISISSQKSCDDIGKILWWCCLSASGRRLDRSGGPKI